MRPRRMLHADQLRRRGHLLRKPDQLHARFLRRLGRLPRIAARARTHKVCPRASAAARSRNHMVQGQLRSRKLFPAVLANAAIPQVNIPPAQWHAHPPMPIEIQQPHHARRRQSPSDQSDPLMPVALELLLECRKLPPRAKVIRLEMRILRVDHFRGPGEQHPHRTLHIQHTQRRKMPIQPPAPAPTTPQSRNTSFQRRKQRQARWSRTTDLSVPNGALLPTELRPADRQMGRPMGFAPITPGLTTQCSDKLSYGLIQAGGIRTPDILVPNQALCAN